MRERKRVIYSILAMEKFELQSIYGCKTIDAGYRRLCGWKSTFKEADKLVRNNIPDLNETVYNYVLIEESEEGLMPFNDKYWLYKFDYEKGGYKRIKISPEAKEAMFNFVFG